MREPNVLTLAPRVTRVTLGPTPEDASSWDFVVDGQTVPEWIRWVADAELGSWLDGRVSTLGGPFAASYSKAVGAQLLARSPSLDTPLYVCPCGDPECGAVVVDIVAKGTRIVWESLRWPGMVSGLPTFSFESGAYRRLISGV